MSRESDALAEVLAAPDDDVPRMAYADLLVARGDPRGELIRVQCAIANGDVEYLEKKELKERAEKLLETHGAAWRAAAGVPESGEVEWRRGFIDVASLTGEQLAGEVGELLFANEPVRHVKVRVNSKRVATRIAAGTTLQRVTALTLQGTISDDGVAALLEGPVDNLRSLNVGGCVSASGLLALTRCPRLAALERLSLSGSELSGALATALRDRWSLLALQVVYASRCDLTDEDIVELASSPVLAQLLTLCVTDNDYTARAVRALAESTNAASIKWLEVDLCDVEAMTALSTSTGLVSLTRLLVNGYEWKLPEPLRKQLRKRYGRGLRYR